MKSFETDGFAIDTGSGYDRKLHTRAPKAQVTHWIVVKDDVPVDLLRENPSGKTAVSVIDSMKEKSRTNRPRHALSAFWPRRIKVGLRYVEITDTQFHSILGRSDEMGAFRKARLPSKRRSKHSEETKRRVIEARTEAGYSWAVISKRYGVPKGTARRWCEGVRKEAPQATLQGRCAQRPETRIDAGPNPANSDNHRPAVSYMEVAQ